MLSELSVKEKNTLCESKNKLLVILKELTDHHKNPNAKPCNDKGNCFSISSSSLLMSDNWTPEHHHYETQYTHIQNKLKDVVSITQFTEYVKKIIKTQYIDSGKQNRNKVAPEVISKLEELVS